jgi:O-antigen/teichoic acid export membrane protein
MMARAFIRGMAENADSLKFRVFRAGSWAVVGYGAALVLRLLGNLVLARLLTPDVFGIMAVATVINVLVGLFSDIGLHQAIIQSKNGQNQDFLNTAWTIQIIRGVWIWIICVFVAALLHIGDVNGWIESSSVYGNPVLPAILAVGPFASVILGFQSIKHVSMSRQLELRRLTLIELIQMFVGLAIAIVLGWLTHSIWSFIVSGLLGSMVTVLLSHFWLPGPRDRLAWDRAALDELMRFGRWVFLSSIIGVLAMNGDRLLLGGWLTATSLGLYSIASGLSSFVDGIAGRIFSSVSLPALGEIVRERPERLAEVLFRMRWGVDSIFVGMAGFLFATGQKIVAILYDPRYLPAGEMLQVLSFGLLFSRYSLAQTAFVALGKPEYIAVINVTKLISLFGVVPLMFYTFDVQGAVLGIALCMFPTVPLTFWFNQKHGLNNIALEVGVLWMWPLGWLVGAAFLRTLTYFH